VIETPKCTVRFDENSHLMLFPSFSRYITSCGRYQPHGQCGGIWKSMLPAGIEYMAGCRLVVMLVVGFRGRVGLVTPTPTGHLPALFGGPFHVQLGGVGVCSLDRAVGVTPGLSLQSVMCLGVFPQQHQTAVYEPDNNKKSASDGRWQGT
jgi:hypothetical protein